jgi:hypothetical protein
MKRYGRDQDYPIDLDYAFSSIINNNFLPIYSEKVSPNSYDNGLKKDLFSQKIVPLYSQGDSLLYLTNIRTFQHELTKKYKEQTIQKIAENREFLKGKYFRIRKSPPSFCKKYRTGIIKTKNSIITEAIFKPMPCMSWTCPECAQYKALRVKYKVIDIILQNDLCYLLTLTLDPQKIPKEYTEHTHKYITKLFNHFITTLKRKRFRYYDKRKSQWFVFDLKNSDKKLKYVWVCEFQKNGNAHLHILFNQFLPVEILRSVWVQIGGGHIMKIEKVKSPQGISMYLTNYIVKGLKNQEKEKGFRYFERRYSISKSCARTKSEIQPMITIPDASAREILYALEQVGLGWCRPFMYNLSKDTYTIYFNTEASDNG